MFHKHPKLFHDPQIDYPIYDFNLPFADYVQKSRKIIADTRQDLAQNAEHIIDANAPFEIRPANKATCGVLLIHGLLDSPFIMQDIGEQLAAQGLLVRSIMLPGHGTVPGALLNTDYTEWQQAVGYGIATLAPLVEKIFLIGFSTGASLSLFHAAENPAITGVVMIAPAVKINSPFTFLASWHKSVSWKWPRAKWMYIGKEIDYVKYQSVAFNAVHQVSRLANAMKEIDSQKLMRCPMLFLLSHEDKIVSSEAALDYFTANKNPANRMLLYAKDNLHFSDTRIIVRNSSYPDMGIHSFCHITLPLALTNAHYGSNGDYPLTSRIDKNKFCYGAYDKIDTKFYQLMNRLKTSKLIHRRLTFNPDFEFFMQQIKQFIK